MAADIQNNANPPKVVALGLQPVAVSGPGLQVEEMNATAPWQSQVCWIFSNVLLLISWCLFLSGFAQASVQAIVSLFFQSQGCQWNDSIKQTSMLIIFSLDLVAQHSTHFI